MSGEKEEKREREDKKPIIKGSTESNIATDKKNPGEKREMSTTEALRTQVDNLRLEIQQLQVENARLKSQLVEENVSESSRDTSALEEEVEELRRRLHEAQEREVNSEQRVQDLTEEHEAVKVKFSDLQEQQTMISQEALELREQCNNYIKEIEHLNGASELAVYRAVERERNKWEERETRWLRESAHHNSRPDEVARSRSNSECTGIPVSISNAVVNSDSGTSIALASPPLSPIMVSTCTTLPSVSMSTASTLSRMHALVTSRDMFSSVGARPTLGADTQAVPSPSFVPPMEMRPSATMMEAGTWSTSRSQLDSDIDTGLSYLQ